jgi:hypothetical protein
LEKKSEYAHRKMDLVSLDRLKAMITNMIRELDVLLWSSRTSDVSDPDTLLEIFDGALDGNELEQRRKLFQDARAGLMESARRVLMSAPEELLERKGEFIEVLRAFCESTTQMNKDFTNRAMAALQKVIDE